MSGKIDIKVNGNLISPDIDKYQKDKLAMWNFIARTQEFKEAFIKGAITPDWVLENWRIRMTPIGSKSHNSFSWDIHII